MFPYRTILGLSFTGLHPILQRFHGEQASQTAHGLLDVTRGSGLFARLIAFMMRLPNAGNGVPVRLSIVRSGGSETWTRMFGERLVVSRQEVSGSALREAFSGITLMFDVEVVGGSLHMVSHSFKLFGIPVGLSPKVTACECATENGWTVTVDIQMRGVGSILQYRGQMVLQ